MSLLHADGGLINLVDWELRQDEVVAAAGIGCRMLHETVSLDGSLSGWVTLHNEPTICNEVPCDPRVAPNTLSWQIEAQIQSAAVAPLVVREQVIGTVVLMGTRPGRVRFEPADLDLLVAFANHAAVAIENARLYEKAQEVAALRERGRLARDLHDAVTQTLFSASLIAEVLPTLYASDPVEGGQLLAELRGLTPARWPRCARCCWSCAPPPWWTRTLRICCASSPSRLRGGPASR